MQFTEFLNQAWTDHAHDSKSVAGRFEGALGLLNTPEDVVKLAHLISHVIGEHLAEFESGRAWLTKLSELECNDIPSRKTLEIYDRSLSFSAGNTDAFSDLAAPEQARGLAVSAGALVEIDINRAEGALRKAVELCAELTPADPAIRAVAVTGNNLASKLEEKLDRTEHETELMLRAAHLGREFWAKAGTWLHIERAENRLAQSYFKAGKIAEAKHHAHECLRICRANEADPDELKYAEDLVRSMDQAFLEVAH